MKAILFLLLSFGIANSGICETPERSLYKGLNELSLPYGRHEISEKALTSAYGPGRMIFRENEYIRRIYYDQRRALWIQFEFHPDTKPHPLVQMVVSKLPFPFGAVAPKKAIQIPPSLLRYFSYSKEDLRAAFKTRLLRRSATVYVPKVNDAILEPAMSATNFNSVEFHFNSGRLVAILVSTP